MTTKNDCFILEDNQKSFTIDKSQIDNRYSNLNLNQNLKCLDVSQIQSNSKSNNDKKCGLQQQFFKLPDSTVSDSYEENSKPQSWNKSSVLCLIKEKAENEEVKKSWKNESSSNPVNKSTLSLHIAAYENLNETTNDSNDIEKEDLKIGKELFNDLSSIIQNPFEFPRQQENEDSKIPEVAQFKTSQRLLNPNTSTKMDSTQEYLIRAGQRNKILGDLDTSVMSEMDEEVSYDSSDRKLEENVQLDKADSNKTYTVESSDIPAIDASTTSESVVRSPLRPFNNRPTIIIQDSPAPTSPLKSKFGKLSQDYQNFEVDIKPTKTKEDYIRGPVKRISMGGEKTTAEFFAPKPHGSTSSATHSGNNSPALPNEQPASGATTSTPKSTALPVNNLPLSPFSNHSSLNASDANETFNNTSMNGIFSFGRKLTTEPTISKIDEAPTKDHSSNVRAPFLPTLPFIAKSTSVESAPKSLGSTSSATHSGNNSPALPYGQPASGAASSSTSNYGKKTDDASSLKYGQKADDLSSAKYGQKVDELKKKFDYPNKGLMPGNTIDNNRVDFGKAKSLFESAFQPTTRYQSPYAAKREQAVTNIRRYDHPNPTKKPAQCEIVTGPTFKQSVDYWQDRERAFPSSEVVDPATQIFKGPTKRENSKGENVFYSTNQQQHPSSYRNDMTSPSPKVSKLYDQPQTAMEQARKLVSFSEEFDGETGNRSTEPQTWKNDKNYGIKPLVVTESFTAFSTLASSKKSVSVTSFSVPSDSFDYQKPAISVKPSESADAVAPLSPLGPSLLDDINQDFTKVHTPVTHKASSHMDGQGDAAAGAAKPALVYSLSNYRKTESTPQRETVKYDNKDVVKEIMSPEVRSSEEMYRQFSHEQIQKKLRQLELAQTVANNQIQQTEKALKVARHTNFKSNYPSYTQEVELLQTLQTLTERRRACYLEFGRLSNASDLYYIFPRATLRFTKIAVDVHRHLDVAPNHYAYLFALVRYNEQVLSSQAVFINPMISQGVGSIEFSDIIEVEDVSPDFSMSIEIYGLTLVRKDSKYDTTRFNIKRMVSSPQPERHHSNETFSRIGQVVIDREDLARQVLDLSSHETPLVGHCRINFQSKITDIDDNKWSGFVSIYRVVDGKGAWELCYSNIQNNRLNFWRYPEDADTKPPILSINMRDMADLARPCCNEKLGFQNDFEVKVIDASENTIQIMLSTAEERDRDRIIAAINRSYKYINAWRFS